MPAGDVKLRFSADSLEIRRNRYSAQCLRQGSIHSFTTKDCVFTRKDCKRKSLPKARIASGGDPAGIVAVTLDLTQGPPTAIVVEAGAGQDRQLEGGGGAGRILAEAGSDGFEGGRLIGRRPAQSGGAAPTGRTGLAPGLREPDRHHVSYDLPTLMQHPAATSRGEATQADERHCERKATAVVMSSTPNRQPPGLTRRWAAAPGCATDRCRDRG